MITDDLLKKVVELAGEALEAAGGDIIEALHGHRCGPNCWHAIGDTAEQRASWWAAKTGRK